VAIGSTPTALAVDFATQIQPLLVNRCGQCHGEEKAAGKLRLHTADAIKEFHEEELLVSGKPDESELLQRIVLPADDPKRMPKGGEPLPQEEIELIRTWIAEGAVLPTSIEAPAETPMEQPEAATAPVDPLAGLEGVAPASAEALAAIEAAGGAAMPLFAGSPLLQVSFAHAEQPAGDAQLAALKGAADQIVWLNLAGSQATPAGYATLAELPHLTQVHLEKSQVTDESLSSLGGLQRLEYLNLYDTKVSDAGLAHLSGLPLLRRLYVWNTQVSFDAAMKLQEARAGLEVNLGWNHPEVAKRRLGKEIEQLKAAAEAATAKATELEQQLKAAQEEQKASAERLQALEQELQKLTGEAAAAEAPAEAAPAEAAPAEAAQAQ
jgi:hypothetical protein